MADVEEGSGSPKHQEPQSPFCPISNQTVCSMLIAGQQEIKVALEALLRHRSEDMLAALEVKQQVQDHTHRLEAVESYQERRTQERETQIQEQEKARRTAKTSVIVAISGSGFATLLTVYLHGASDFFTRLFHTAPPAGHP